MSEVTKVTEEIQITADQVYWLREFAKEPDLEILSKQKISDPYELADYQHRERKMFEDIIRKNHMITNWIKYAQWEESQEEIDRARSIYERALKVDNWCIVLWLKYTEMEMRCGQVNHARNVFDRVVSLLPRANQFWYMYTYMEETLENIAGARQVYERWMEWKPNELAWQTYIKFELYNKEIDRARQIYERFTLLYLNVERWIEYARFEESYGFIKNARAIYERAIKFYEYEYHEELYFAFARFEEGQREHDRASAIYKYAIIHIKPKNKEIYEAYMIHEKKYGDRSGIEDVIVSKRKEDQYEQEIKENPTNYDAWFDYLRLVESEGNIDVIRKTYTRAVSNVPPTKEKQFWRRYIYLWIKFALFEELEAKDIGRCRQVYKVCLDIIPHERFSFSKIWLLYAYFEIRQKNLFKAKEILELALETCPSNKLFRSCIDLEAQLIDHLDHIRKLINIKFPMNCTTQAHFIYNYDFEIQVTPEVKHIRKLHEKFLAFAPENCTTWVNFALLEIQLDEFDHARAICKNALAQPRLDKPELLWKVYILFEVIHGGPENVYELYELLLERTLYVRVWISYALYKMFHSGLKNIFDIAVRNIFERGNDALRFSSNTKSRVLLLEEWKNFESARGTPESLAKVMEKMPRKHLKKMRVVDEDGNDDGWEEVLDFVFPEDEYKILGF